MNKLSGLDSTAVTFEQLLATEDILRQLSNVTMMTEEARAALDLAKDVFCSLRIVARLSENRALDVTRLRDRLMEVPHDTD